MLHHLVIRRECGGKTAQMFAFSNFHEMTYQLYPYSQALEWISDQDTQTRLIRSVNLAQTGHTQDSWFPILVLVFRNKSYLAIVIAMTETRQALMQNPFRQQHWLQITHIYGPVGKRCMEFCQEWLVLRQDRAYSDLCMTFYGPGACILSGIGSNSQL